MKRFTIALLLIAAVLLIAKRSFAQSEIENYAPLKAGTSSPYYASDVIIDDQPTEDQLHANLAVAFNGWLYAAYSASVSSVYHWVVKLSKDNGQTWTTLVTIGLSTNWYVVDMDILVTGTTTSDLVVFVGRIYQNDVAGSSELRVTRFDGNTGTALNTLRDNVVTLPERFNDIAMASDYLFPGKNTSPFSVGILYSKYQATSDSVILLTSTNGGAGITNENIAISTGRFVRNVSLAYGYSPTWLNGRYFAAWEERNSATSDVGYIYTAHTNPYVYSPFLAPVQVDNLLTHSETFCRFPSISCQFSSSDNDLGNLTEVILFDRAYDGNTSTRQVVGVYNKTATNSTSFSIFGLDASMTNIDMMPDINFDPYYNNFLATFYRNTTQGLMYWVEHMTMPDPYNWGLINGHYNDGNNLSNPYPKVEINPMEVKVAHVWTADRLLGNGISMFDAEYSTLGIPPANRDATVKVFPNPAGATVSFTFENPVSSDIVLTLTDLAGKQVVTVTDARYPAGIHTVVADVSTLDEGIYIYRLSVGTLNNLGRIVIIR